MLKVSAIDRGSIWISLKSGSQDALKYLALFFERSASAKLSQEVSEALKSKTEAQISEETRKAVSEAKISEQEKLKLENIHQTYQSLRKEWKERIEFTNQLIEEVDDPELAEKLKKRKDETIAELLEQKMVPIVRNIPGSYFTQQPTSSIDGKTLSLPPPSSSES